MFARDALFDGGVGDGSGGFEGMVVMGLEGGGGGGGAGGG